jgi:hypothetical protein
MHACLLFPPPPLRAQLNMISAYKVLDFAGFGLSTDRWLQEYKANQSKLFEYYKHGKYDACRVFVVFESETAQRLCLKELTAGLIPSLFDIQTVKDEYLFRGSNQLIVGEAPEPHDVCWENLGMTTGIQLVLQKLFCFFYLTCLNVVCAMLVFHSFVSYPSMVTTVLIASIDEYTPPVIRLIVDATEIHDRYSDRQLSIMTQMYLFLIVNSAVVIYMITPVMDTLSYANIQQVRDNYKSETARSSSSA